MLVIIIQARYASFNPRLVMVIILLQARYADINLGGLFLKLIM